MADASCELGTAPFSTAPCSCVAVLGSIPSDMMAVCGSMSGCEAMAVVAVSIPEGDRSACSPARGARVIKTANSRTFERRTAGPLYLLVGKRRSRGKSRYHRATRPQLMQRDDPQLECCTASSTPLAASHLGKALVASILDDPWPRKMDVWAGVATARRCRWCAVSGGEPDAVPIPRRFLGKPAWGRRDG